MILSQDAARTLMLAAQGLLRQPDTDSTPDDVRRTIQRMGYLQIDTISVVARSQFLVLWSRLGSYDVDWLETFLAEGILFEYWAHAAAMLPIEDYPIYRRQMLDGTRTRKWLVAHAEEAERMLAHIREAGPVRSGDFARPEGKKGQGWWDWKPEKIVLETLFDAGEVMVAKRHNFHRLYDLRERVLPQWSDADAPTAAEAEIVFARKATRALGVAQAGWIARYFYRKQQPAQKAIAALVAAGELRPVTVEGWSQPAYIHRENDSLVAAAVAGILVPDLTVLLSPFDPLVSDRDRARQVFGFDYTIECYTPEAKRRYGYFTLPILHNGQLVGRVDAKAWRKEGLFEVKKLHLEPHIVASDPLAGALARMLLRLAAWHKTPEVVVRWTDPPGFGDLLCAALAEAEHEGAVGLLDGSRRT